MQGIPVFSKEGLCGRICRGQSKENAECDGPGSHRLGSELNDSLICTLNYLHLAESSTCRKYWFRCNLVLETHSASISYQSCNTGQIVLAAKELCSSCFQVIWSVRTSSASQTVPISLLIMDLLTPQSMTFFSFFKICLLYLPDIRLCCLMTCDYPEM